MEEKLDILVAKLAAMDAEAKTEAIATIMDCLDDGHIDWVIPHLPALSYVVMKGDFECQTWGLCIMEKMVRADSQCGRILAAMGVFLSKLHDILVEKCDAIIMGDVIQLLVSMLTTKSVCFVQISHCVTACIALLDYIQWPQLQQALVRLFRAVVVRENEAAVTMQRWDRTGLLAQLLRLLGLQCGDVDREAILTIIGHLFCCDARYIKAVILTSMGLSTVVYMATCNPSCATSALAVWVLTNVAGNGDDGVAYLIQNGCLPPLINIAIDPSIPLHPRWSSNMHRLLDLVQRESAVAAISIWPLDQARAGLRDVARILNMSGVSIS